MIFIFFSFSEIFGEHAFDLVFDLFPTTFSAYFLTPLFFFQLIFQIRAGRLSTNSRNSSPHNSSKAEIHKPGPKRKVVLQPSIFQGRTVKLRGVYLVAHGSW